MLIAGAEERGRRRGETERDNALKAAHDYCLYMFKRQWLTDPRNRYIFAARIFAILDAALAPRDSAPKRDPYVEAGVDDWSGAPRDDMTKAPRDSGKDADELMRALRDSATVSTRPPPSRK